MAVLQPLWIQETSEVAPRFETGGRNSHLRASDENMPVPVREDTAAQLTLLMLHLSAFNLRPSELLALKEKGLVAPLVPLLQKWLLVIATSET